MTIRYVWLAMLLWHGGICAFSWFKQDRAAYAAQQESWDSAKSLLKELVRDNPDDPSLVYDAGVSSYKLGEIAQARGYFQQAAASPKADPNLKEQSLFNLGNTYMNDEEYKQAIEAYEQALKINPDNERTKHNKKIAEEKQRQKEQQQKQDEKKNDQDKKDDQDKKNPDRPEPDEGNKDQDQNQDQDKQDQNQQDQNKDQKDKGSQDKGDQDKQQKQDEGKDQQGNESPDEKEGKQDKQKGGNQGQDKKQKKEQKKSDAGDQDQGDQEKKQKEESDSGKSEKQKDKQEKKQQGSQEGKSDKKGQGAQAAGAEKEGEDPAFKNMKPQLARMLQAQESSDAQLQKQLIKAQVGNQMGARDGENCW